MPRVGVEELKDRTTQIMRDVSEHAAEYVVTVDGSPVAVITPYPAARHQPHPTDEEIDAWYKRFDELSARISALWPPGLSAADAVAEQRRDLGRVDH